MNEFDQLLFNLNGVDNLDGLDGFFSKVRKKLKKAVKKVGRVAKSVFKPVRKVTSTAFKYTFKLPFKYTYKLPFKYTYKKVIKPVSKRTYKITRKATSQVNKLRRKVRRTVVPKAIRNFENKVGREIATNDALKAVITVVAAFYGLGLVVDGVYTAIALYDAKVAKGIKPTVGDIKAFHESLNFLVQMTLAEQEKIIKTLSPKVQTDARKYLAAKRAKLPASKKAPPKTIAAVSKMGFNAGVEMANTGNIKEAVSLMLRQGKSADEIMRIISGSQFYKSTEPAITESVIQPIIERQYRDSPNSVELSQIQAIELASKPKGGLEKLLLPAAAIALTLLV